MVTDLPPMDCEIDMMIMNNFPSDTYPQFCLYASLASNPYPFAPVATRLIDL